MRAEMALLQKRLARLQDDVAAQQRWRGIEEQRVRDMVNQCLTLDEDDDDDCPLRQACTAQLETLVEQRLLNDSSRGYSQPNDMYRQFRRRVRCIFKAWLVKHQHEPETCRARVDDAQEALEARLARLESRLDNEALERVGVLEDKIALIQGAFELDSK